MDEPRRLVNDLVAIGTRGACTDAERRASRLLVRTLREAGRRPKTQTVWVRPQWPWIWLLHVAIAIGASVAAVDAPVAGLVAIAIVTVSAAGQLTGRFPLLALLWPRRASQNVVARDPREAPVRLVLAAPYDAPRTATGMIRGAARVEGALRRVLRGRWPHPLTLLTLAFVAITGCAIARVAGAEGTTVGAIQLPPTVACIIAAAFLADLALGRATPGASAQASAAAAALSVAGALDRRPPRNLAVDVVLAGASDGAGHGMRAFVRSQRRALRPEEVAVLHFEPCGAGATHVWTHQGPAVALALHPRLVALADGIAERHRGHGTGGAYVARQARWPTIAFGTLDARGLHPLARHSDDDPEHLDHAAIRRTVDAALQLVARLDADLAGRSS